MPAPSTVQEFLDLIRKSGVVEESRLSAYLMHLQTQSDIPRELNKYAGIFVRDGLLTYFQAEQFLQGKWKRFTIGKYKVLERLGSGGMGQVFLCEHKLMRRKVAVKVLPTAKAEDQSALERFYREARAVAALDHPNIVRAYDIDQDENLHFLVMEYVDGASLQEIIKRHGPMDINRACHYIYWSAIGLEHAHQAGLIHRDIKPGNILIDRQGTVKILDLGLARFFNDDADLLTKKYDENVLGTADYLAPEQAIDSHNIDGRADIYSLGATFYFMLTGHQPFVEGTVAQKLLWHQSRLPRPIADERPEVPAGVIEIVNRMMAKDRNKRYQTPGEVAEALLPWVQTPIEAPPAKEMPQLSPAAMAAGGGQTSTVTRIAAVAPSTRSTSSIYRTSSGTSGSVRVQPTTPPADTNTPLTINSQPTHRVVPPPIVEPVQETSQRVWESLAEETNPPSVADTHRQTQSQPRPAKTPSTTVPKRQPAEVKTSRGLAWLMVGLAAGLLLLGGGGYAIWHFAFRGESKQTDTPQVSSTKLIVSRQPTAGQYGTVREAIENAQPGAQIVIADDVWEEELSTRPPKDLTIGAAEGKTVTWKMPTRSGSSKKIINLINPENLHLRGIHFLGEGRIGSALNITGKCPGLHLEYLEFTRFLESGITFIDASGEEKKPALIEHCRFVAEATNSQCALQFQVSNPIVRAGQQFANNLNQSIVVRECRFEGAFRSALSFEGTNTDIEIRQNRFWKCVDGIFVKESRPDHTLRLKIVSNTFHTVSGKAIHLTKATELLTAYNVGRNRLEILQNYFANVPSIVFSGDAKDLRPIIICSDNARNNPSKEGNFNLMAQVIDVNLPINPADEKTFLRSERNGPLIRVGTNARTVGVPPAE